jgi:very-short-patch-repair endonuclease
MDAQLRGQAAAQLADYAPLWTAWAEGEKPRRKSIALYGDLFALKHQLESEETAKPHELVWGLGVAAWKLQYEERSRPVTIDFQYPILTQTVELSLDESTLAIEVRPRAIEPRLEFDAFIAAGLHGAAEVERTLKENLARSAEQLVTPFDPGSFESLLKLVAGNLHERGRYEPAAEAFPVPGEALVVSDAWVLLSRPRPGNYLHEDIERLKTGIRDGAEIPLGPLALVTPPSDALPEFEPITFRGLSGGSNAVGEGKPQELFFPLPYNHEQVTIVEQLERSSGVAVQGPPGTGKTHTIANIVCHYLATGRKVLVTSKGEQALKELQSKIPEDVRPLTVALLAGDREGMRQFQSSIEAIIHNVSQLNPAIVRDQIASLDSAIDRAHAELASIDRRINDIAATQLSEVAVDGVGMRAQKMAELVVSGAERFGWFDDELSLDPTHAPPLDTVETAMLRLARHRLGEDLIYVGARLPSSQALLSAEDVGRLHDVLVSMRDIEAAQASGSLLALRAATPEILDEARQLLAQVEAAMQLAEELEATGEVWTAELRNKCRQSSYASERQALEALFSEIEELIDARAEFLKRPVDMPEPILAAPKAKEAIERGVENGKPFGLLSLGGSDVKAQVGAIRVAGLPPANSEDWKHVQRYVDLHGKVLSFSVRWNAVAGLLSVPEVHGGVTALRHIELLAVNARKAHRLALNHDAHLPVLATTVFAEPPIAQLRGNSKELRGVREHLRSHLTRAELARAATQLAVLHERLAGTTGPIAVALREFVEAELGQRQFPPERIVARYTELLSALRRVENLAHDIATVNAMAGQLEAAGAARLAARVRAQPATTSGDDTVFPANWRDAWNWARVKTHLDNIEARDELRRLATRRSHLESGLARLYVDLVSKAAWLATKEGASPRVLSALETYRTAVRRIGQGTGPNAVRHRRDAQKAMYDAQGAVPCWVMSHAKVSETLPAHLGSFDLIIVDEASQSDLWALPTVLRGKKILVVGDDKQVSPDGAFINAARIQELKDRFLADQPYAPILTPEKSLYDIASTVFAASKVMLREHFRCVPPIIAYSNHTFYKDFIQPLRIPKASERMDPPLVDIFVPTGRRDAQDLNKEEAQAIAAEIEALLADEKFAGRTLGVVSLLGPGQAKHIDQLIRSRCDANELLRRNFTCGDARMFQGSERDIMFLSMVASPGDCRALAGNAFEQRFNVAASRARDRMYLVRSVQLTDLSAADIRVGLLSHFCRPMGGSVDESKSLIDQCESGFERQVYAELFTRGYRVVPQVKAGSFRIDMVVEGANDTRLAIECDGDEFHGPDRWQADMSRQRVLERAGWTFWRCFASTWSLRKEDVLSELLERLNGMGIEPLGALERIPEFAERRTYVGAGMNGQHAGG